MLLTTVGGLAACNNARPVEPAPVSPGGPTPLQVGPHVRFSGQEARDDPEKTLLGSWELSTAATLEANAGLPEGKLRDLRQSIMPGMAGVVMTYEAGGASLVSARGAPAARGTWKTLKVEPPNILLEVTTPDAPPSQVTMEIVRPDLIQTRLLGFVLALRRTASSAGTGVLPAGTPALLAQPQSAGGKAAATRTVRGVPGATPFYPPAAGDPALDARNQHIREENRRVDAANQNTQNSRPDLYVKPGNAPAAPSGASPHADALLADPNLSETNRRVLMENRRVEERNNRARQGAPLYVPQAP